jgi:hypothetical protein
MFVSLFLILLDFFISSRARVNLPRIGYGKCIKIVLQHNFFNKTKNLAFLSRNFYGK